MSDKGIFGDLFDLNNDGHLDEIEKATEFSAVMETLKKNNEKNNDNNNDK